MAEKAGGTWVTDPVNFGSTATISASLGRWSEVRRHRTLAVIGRTRSPNLRVKR